MIFQAKACIPAHMAAHRTNTVAGAARLARFLFSPAGLLLAALGLLVPGVFLPLVTVEKLLFFTDQVSLYDGIMGLYENQEYFLASVLLAFSMVFPLAKILIGLAAALRPGKATPPAKLLGLLAWLGKWSMLDVFIVGLLVVSIKSNYLADAGTEPGLYFFTASIVLSLAATHRLLKQGRTKPASR